MRFALIIFLLPSFVFAQQSDAGLWASVSLERHITTKLSYSISEEVRLFNNLTSVGTLFTDAGFNYKFNKIFRVSVNYRFTQKLEPGNQSNRSRYYADFSARKKFSRILIIDRVRLQSQFNDYFTSDNGRAPYYYIRNLILFKLDLDRRYEPYLGGEVFYQLNNPRGNEIDNLRLKTGCDFEINKHNKIDVGVLLQKEINKNNPLFSIMGSINYSYVF